MDMSTSRVYISMVVSMVCVALYAENIVFHSFIVFHCKKCQLVADERFSRAGTGQL